MICRTANGGGARCPGVTGYASQGVPCTLNRYRLKEQLMGKYFLGWILGVPAIVLVLIYVFMH